MNEILKINTKSTANHMLLLKAYVHGHVFTNYQQNYQGIPQSQTIIAMIVRKNNNLKTDYFTKTMIYCESTPTDETNLTG